ncbi:MAG: hypothetical protein ABIL09_18105 [Gemmatimonadota bacterium]
MLLRIRAAGGIYYTRGPGSIGWLSWRREGDQWVREAGSVPDGATEVTLPDLPGALTEELLAFAARAEVITGTGSRN